jgi:hypothetical protein
MAEKHKYQITDKKSRQRITFCTDGPAQWGDEVTQEEKDKADLVEEVKEAIETINEKHDSQLPEPPFEPPEEPTRTFEINFRTKPYDEDNTLNGVIAYTFIAKPAVMLLAVILDECSETGVRLTFLPIDAITGIDIIYAPSTMKEIMNLAMTPNGETWIQ